MVCRNWFPRAVYILELMIWCILLIFTFAILSHFSRNLSADCPRTRFYHWNSLLAIIPFYYFSVVMFNSFRQAISSLALNERVYVFCPSSEGIIFSLNSILFTLSRTFSNDSCISCSVAETTITIVVFPICYCTAWSCIYKYSVYWIVVLQSFLSGFR